MANNILAQLKSSEWTLEVIMASSNSAKNMRPVVRIKLQFEDDDEQREEDEDEEEKQQRLLI